MLRLWASKTTWHGVSDCFGSEKKGCQLLWLLILSISALMFISGSFYHIIDFFTGKTWTTSTFEESQNGSIELPKIIVCDMNIASNRRMEALNMSVMAAKFVVKQLLKEGKQNRKTKAAFVEYLDQHPEKRNISLVEWSELLAPSCEPFIYDCNLGGGRNQEDFECCGNMKSIPVLGNGRCFLLDLPRDIRDRHPQTQVGAFGSLTLYTSTRISDYANMKQRKEAGLLLYVGYDPRTSLYSTPLAVQPGSKNYVSMSVQQTRISRLSVIIPNVYPLYNPPPECKLDGQLQVLEGNYVLESCLDDCAVQMDLKYCGCVRFDWVKPHIPICQPLQWQECKNIIPEMEGDDNWEELMACKNSCNTACSQFTVTLRQSATLYPIPAITGWLQNHMSGHHGELFEKDEIQHFSMVEIFFESITVRVVETYPRMPVEMLVANIGGTLGVWAGISFITIYQAAVYGFHAFSAFAQGRKAKYKVEQTKI